MITPSKTDFNNAIDRILEGIEYRHLSNGFRDLIDRIKGSLGQWLSRGLNRIIGNEVPSQGISDGLSTLLLTLGILAILALIIVIIVKISGVFEKNNKIKEILGEKITKDTTPMGLRLKASKYMAEGDYRQAIRFDFIAILLLMHEKAIIYLEDSQTNLELYNTMKRNGFSGFSLFHKISDYFNYIWYGHKSFNEEDLTQWRREFEAMWNEVMKYEG